MRYARFMAAFASQTPPVARYVLLAHLLLLGWCALQAPPRAQKPVRHPVAVSTHLLIPPQPQKRRSSSLPEGGGAQAAPPKTKMAEAKKEAMTPPKKVERPPPTKKAPPKSSPPQKPPEEAARSAPSGVRRELAEKMKESLSSLTPSSSASAAASVAPPLVGPLASESWQRQASYYDRLISFLEGALTLPEEGEVKISLTLSRNGTVSQMSVREASSRRNRTYIEQELPLLHLPPFEGEFSGHTSETFTITLTSS